MARYHNTEQGPRVCQATVRACPIGDSSVHFANRAEAQQAYEKKLDESEGKFKVLGKHIPLEERLETAPPSEIDGKLAEIYSEVLKNRRAALQFTKDIKAYEEYMKKYPEGSFHIKRYEDSIARATVSLEEAKKNEAKGTSEMEKYNQEFDRRGGWSRAFLVSNGNGHVHKDMNCSTCYPTTEYQWMTDYSGRDQAAIVEDAGERACTVCYPDAPVSTLRRKTKMFTEDEKKAEEAREAREAAREEKRKKDAVKAITTPAGEPLKIKSGSFSETVKTERTASIYAVEHQENILRMERKKTAGESYNAEWFEEQKGNLSILLEALAHKRGVSEKEVAEEVLGKAKKRLG